MSPATVQLTGPVAHGYSKRSMLGNNYLESELLDGVRNASHYKS